MDDITFCIDECQEFSCERNPENIMHPELPHSFAHLQQTEYCPLWRQEVEKVEVVRCKDCKHRPTATRAEENIYYGFSVEFPDEQCPCHCGDEWYNWYPNDNFFCARGERRDDS